MEVLHGTAGRNNLLACTRDKKLLDEKWVSFPEGLKVQRAFRYWFSGGNTIISHLLLYSDTPLSSQMFLLQRSVHIYVVLVVLYLNLRIVYYLFLALRQKLLTD